MKRYLLFFTTLFTALSYSTAAYNYVDCTNLLINVGFDEFLGYNEPIPAWSGNFNTASNSSYTFFSGRFAERWCGKYATDKGYTLQQDGTTYYTLKDCHCTQTVEVKNGLYVLDAYVIAYNQDNQNLNPVQGVLLCANGNATSCATDYQQTSYLTLPKRHQVHTIVTDGSLTVSLRTKETTANWVAWDNVMLRGYFGKDDNECLVLYAKDELNALKVVAEELMKNKLNTSLLNGIKNSIARIDEQILWEDAKALWDTFSEQISKAKKSVAAYKKLEAEIAYAYTWQKKGFGIGTEDFNRAVSNAVNIYEEAILNTEDVESATTTLDDALLSFFIHNADGREYLNVTDKYIVNPSLRHNSEGWEGSKPMNEYEVMEFYGTEYNLYQRLTDLPSGIYMLSVQGFNRATLNDEGEAYWSGTEDITAELYANENSVPMTSLYKYTASEIGVKSDEVLHDYLNMRVSSEEAFNKINPALGIPYYAENSVEVIVRDGNLIIGLRDENPKEANWCAFRDFKLEYYGRGQTANKYRAIYIVDGDIIRVDSIYCDNKIPHPNAPDKEGYTFVEWEGPEIMPAEDVVIIGKFAINKYLVTFKIGDEVIASDSLEYGAILVAPEAPEKEGYTFSGWSEIPETMPANDITIKGTFTINKYLVTFKIGDEVIASDSLEHGAILVAPEAPEKEGYTFSGWSEIPETMPANDITIKGTFTINKYLVTFKIGDEVIASDSLEYGAILVAPEAPEKEGYTFNGWGEVVETVPASDVSYEGSYSVNSYALTCIVDGETISTDSIAYGKAIILPETPEKEGYTFSGWSEIPETMPANDVTIKGTFIVNKYLVTFMIDEVILVSDSLEYGAKITLPSTPPNRAGYTFSGWGDIAETVPANDVTYNAYYIINVYKVFYFVGTKLVNVIDVTYGEPIPEYIYKPEEGYVFLGWVGDTYETMPAHDVTYTANIESGINQITIDNGYPNIYDLTGRKVNIDDLEELSEGIYIINGRKVVVKIGMGSVPFSVSAAISSKPVSFGYRCKVS